MTREEKDLVLHDLCARLPYRLKGKCEIDASYDTSFDTVFQLHKFDAVLEGIKGGLLFVTPLIEDKDEQEFANEEVADGIDIFDFKPYLRPMSSMTEEEKKEYIEYAGYEIEESVNGRHYEYYLKDLCGTPDNPSVNADGVDWLNKNMFDYRGLIPKDIAIKVTEENNPYKD